MSRTVKQKPAAPEVIGATDTIDVPTAPPAPPAPITGDALAAAGIRTWCRGVLLILTHREHLTIANVIDAVIAAANSGGLTREEAALFAEMKVGEVFKNCQHVRSISS